MKNPILLRKHKFIILYIYTRNTAFYEIILYLILYTKILLRTGITFRAIIMRFSMKEAN